MECKHGEELQRGEENVKHNIHAKKRIEFTVLIIFVLLYIVITIFHEPWFDEAQAWEIAKGASLQEMFFTIPHYEGHPPLWHLILLIPARIGIPFEIGLKTIGAIISIAYAILLIYKSNLPWIARICLPFSFFLFYQYGVIVRPYGLMVIIMLLLGMSFPRRKDHPWFIVLLLSLICLCSAYGIVIAAGIALCLVIELINDKGIKQTILFLFKDPRTLSLFALLIIATLLLFEIFPRTDTFYAAYKDQNPFVICFFCALFTFPAECFLTSSSWFSLDRTLLQTTTISITELIALCLIGIILWGLIICSASKRTLKFLIIPYIFLAFFSSVVYFSGHHLGVIFMFFLFWAEYVFQEKEDRFEFGRILLKKIVTREKDYKLIKYSYYLIGVLCLIIPIIWTIISSINEVSFNYDYGRETASFLDEHKLVNLHIMGNWYEYGSLIPSSEGDEGYVNTVMIGNAVPVNAYFKNNIFYNLNHDDYERGFIYHRRPTHEEADSDLMEWRSFGYPDVIVGKPKLELVYGDDLTYEDYSLVKLVRTRFIWKAGTTSGIIPVFLKKGLVEEYRLEPLDGIEYTLINGLRITDDMKERYYNGESAEEILKPYLDAMFGNEEK